MSEKVMQEINETESLSEKATGNDKISSSIRSDSRGESNNLNPSGIMTSISSLVCRICHTNTVHEALISPCYCKGSLAYVHLSCLERWLNQSSRNYCELCMYQYNAVQTQRYGLIEGIRMWIMHPRNRTHIQSDVLILVLLTIVTVGLIVVCLLGIHYFEIEGEKIGISKNWTKGAIIFFLCIVIVGYLITLYLMIKDQVVPWYQWWKRTLDVRLLLTPSVIDDSVNVERQNRETSV